MNSVRLPWLRLTLCLPLLFATPVRADVKGEPAPVSADNLTVPPGFKAEVLRVAAADEGSWVCMTVDAKGRFIISPEGSPKNPAGGMFRLTLGADGKVAKFEPINLPVGGAMGLLYAFDSLYVSGQGPQGTGIYRLRDTDGDDQYDKAELLKKLEGWYRESAVGEHGPHGIVLGPDNHLYIINGNETKPISGLRPDSPHKNFAEDQLLPPWLWPPNYTWANGNPPGGCVYRTDADGKEWTLICGGLRNSYDLAFNRDGEMFTFDSDMDWDDGSPWYRPTRINHLVSGGEYGWRKGTGKWPDYYPDSLPTTLDLGRSSPTGMKFGTLATNFPPKYRRSLFLCDWAFGRIFATQLTPSGATYKASAEPFVIGRPLNVTDLEFGQDGAMYFITGGRGTQSALFHVRYTEPLERDPVPWDLAAQTGAKARELRHKLEAFHGHHDPKAVDFAWEHLNSDDRWIRYAARIAIEWQDVAQWQERALAETRPNAMLAALLALARCGDEKVQEPILDCLGRLPPGSLDEEQSLDALRLLEVCFTRLGRPQPETERAVAEKLIGHYPAKSDRINRELCALLVYLNAPDAVPKTMALLAQTPTQEQQFHYVFTLRNATAGWTPELRTAYFQWFPAAAHNYSGSDKFIGFLNETRKDAMSKLSETERVNLGALLTEKVEPAAPVAAAPRAFVKDWTMEELLLELPKVSGGRSFQKGRDAFAGAQCILCHRLGNSGGAIGPDITAAASRFNRHDLLEAIVQPSKVVSDQFQNTLIITKDGEDHTGRVMAEDDQKVVLQPNPLANDRVEISKAQIKSRQASKISPMPEGLLNVLTREEILDLLAYVESGGSPDSPGFKK